MHKTLLVIIFFGFAVNGYTQIENINYKAVISRFEESYNKGNYDSIFYMFSSQMKKELSLEKTIKFLSETKSMGGKMLSKKFEGLESSYATYKAVFERRTYSFYLSLDNNSKINGFYIQPYIPNDLPKLQRNSTKLILPFANTWTVLWGGDTKELNYHIEVPAQKAAFDFIITDTSGKSYKTDSKTNEDYYAFGKEILAACNGEIIMVVDGVKDNIPGKVNPMFVTGNTIILKTDKNEFILYAHFKKHSIIVKEGQLVKQGQLLGLCGNSGNSLEPHLHFQIQNVEDLNIATGAKCYFETILVNGKIKKDYSPIKGERIQNEQ